MSSVLAAVGNTPIVRLEKVVPPGCADILVKLESVNPTGSYKDRMALAMIEEAEKRGDLKRGMTVVEYTGGSTGSSLAFVCAIKGYRFRVVSSDAFAEEKLRTMRAFGAELELEPSVGGLITPDLIPRMMDRARKIAEEGNSYYSDQFNNRDTLQGYRKIGEELLRQVESPLDVYCGAVGTAGMLMGVAGALRDAGAATRFIAFEPASSAVISTGRAGTHHVEGIGAGFIPPLLDRGLLHEARGIDEAEARAMARRLTREEGLFAGISSGMNVVGAIQIGMELGPGHTIVTIACDSGLKYLAGDLYNESGE